MGGLSGGGTRIPGTVPYSNATPFYAQGQGNGVQAPGYAQNLGTYRGMTSDGAVRIMLANRVSGGPDKVKLASETEGQRRRKRPGGTIAGGYGL